MRLLFVLVFLTITVSAELGQRGDDGWLLNRLRKDLSDVNRIHPSDDVVVNVEELNTNLINR